MKIRILNVGRSLLICFLSLLLCNGCKKEILNQSQKTDGIETLQSRDEIPEGWENLMALSELDNSIKDGILDYDYHYFRAGDDDQLWIVRLSSSVLGFSQSKAIISYKEGDLNVKFLSFDFSEQVYENESSKIYNGSLNIYDQELTKENEIFFNEGSIFQSYPIELESNPIMMINLSHETPPTLPDFQINWCSVMPSLCNYWSNGNSLLGVKTSTFLAAADEREPGGGGSSNITLSDLAFIGLTLQTTTEQENWLILNPARRKEIFNYLKNSPLLSEQKNEIAKQHLEKIITDTDYRQFITDYADNNPNSPMWWENDVWLSNSNNIKFELDDEGWGELNSTEKWLCILYPMDAWAISKNVLKAKNETISRFGVDKINTKGDAFKHAFFNALNYQDCSFTLDGYGQTANVAELFADAHELTTAQALHLEKEMDLWNNEIGFQVGHTANSSTTEQQIANTIFSKLTGGELRYISDLDFTASAPYDDNEDGVQDCVTCLNGITSSSRLIPTNQ